MTDWYVGTYFTGDDIVNITPDGAEASYPLEVRGTLGVKARDAIVTKVGIDGSLHWSDGAVWKMQATDMQVGQKVAMRDRRKPWQKGVVKSVEPLRVAKVGPNGKSGGSYPLPWDHVFPFSQTPLTTAQLRQLEIVSRLWQLEPRNESLEAAKADLESRNKSLEAVQADLESRNKRLEAVQADLESRNKRLEAVQADLESRNKRLEAAKADLESRNKRLEAAKADLESRNKSLEAAKADLESSNKSLEAVNVSQLGEMLRVGQECAHWRCAYGAAFAQANRLESQLEKFQSTASRFPRVASLYPPLANSCDEVLAKLQIVEGLPRVEEIRVNVEYDILQHFKYLITAGSMDNLAESISATGLGTDLVSLTSLHKVLLSLVEKQPGILGKELGSTLCSQLQSMLNYQGGFFQREEMYLQSAIQEFVVDLKVQVERQGEEFSLYLSDQSQREQQLQEQMRFASEKLSNATEAALWVDHEDVRTKAAKELLQVLWSKQEVSTSKGAALMKLLVEKRSLFVTHHREKLEEWRDAVQQACRRIDTAECKLQQWDMALSESRAQYESASAAFQESEHTLSSAMQRQDCLLSIDAMVEFEKQRHDLLWKCLHVECLETLAARETAQLEEELALAKEHHKWKKEGLCLLQKFSQWITDLYTGIDVRAERNIAEFRRELPQDLEKIKQLLLVVKFDFQRRERETEHAIYKMRCKLEQIDQELLCAARCRRLEEGVAEQRTKRTEDLLSLQQDLQNLVAEQQEFNVWLGTHVVDYGDNPLSIVVPQNVLPTTWAADLFFAPREFHVMSSDTAKHFENVARVSPCMFSIGSNIESMESSYDKEGGFTLEPEGVPLSSMSSPAATRLNQCFLPDSELMTPNGPVAASQLRVGDLLATPGGTTHVKALRLLPLCDRDIVEVFHAKEVFQLTDSHYVAAGPDGSGVCVGEVRNGRSLFFLEAVAKSGSALQWEIKDAQVNVRRQPIATPVIEVELSDRSDIIFLQASQRNDTEEYTGLRPCMAVLGTMGSTTLFVVAGPHGKCLTVTDQDPREDSASCRSDPLHAKLPARRIVRTIRPPHNENCSAVCRYYLLGQCRNGKLCTRCHDASHKRQHVPGHRGSSASKRYQKTRSRSTT